MQLETTSFAELVPARVYPADRTVGVILMILAAIGIPLLVFGAIAKTAVLSVLAAVHAFHLFHGGHVSHVTQGDTFVHTIFGLVTLSGLVYAGYAISRTQRAGFLVALVIGVAALLMHTSVTLALGAVIYSALRLFAGVGPRLN
jgi:hypothetical protein